MAKEAAGGELGRVGDAKPVLQASALPEGSYGRRNRQAIAARETRVATRLRAVQHAYHTAIEGGAVFQDS